MPPPPVMPRQNVPDPGSLTLYAVPGGEAVQVRYGIDAREMLAAGSYSLTPPEQAVEDAMSDALEPAPEAPADASPAPSATAPTEPMKRRRGRPPGSGRRKE